VREHRKPVHVGRSGNVRVPVYRYGDGRFCVAYRKAAGSAPKRETFVVKKEAIDRADEMAIAIANGQADVLELTSADRDSYLLAKHAVQEHGIPLHAAIEEWAAARKIIGGSHSLIEAANFFQRGQLTPHAAPPAAQILDELIAQLADRQPSKQYSGGLKRDLGRFIAVHPDLTAVSEAQIRAYLRALTDRRTKQPVGLRRRDNVRDAIVRLCRFARRAGYLAEDKKSPAEKIESLSTGGEVTTYSPTTLATLIEHVPHEWRPWMAIAAFAGLRTSEIFRLEWRDVKWGHKIITVRRAVAKKVRVARMVPMTDTLIAWLALWREADGPVCPKESRQRRKKATGTASDTIASWRALESRHSRMIAAIEKATGIAWEKNALRHSFGSHRLALVKSIDQVALEMGTSPAKVRENYHDPKTEGEAKAYFGILPPELKADNILPLALEFR
jgi:integrase